jgi:hypothetical protein
MVAKTAEVIRIVITVNKSLNSKDNKRAVSVGLKLKLSKVLDSSVELLAPLPPLTTFLNVYARSGNGRSRARPTNQ